MKAIIDECTTTILVSKEEAEEYCKIGQGADCCIWLCVGADGFECLFYNRPISLIERWEAGLTTAKRNGCEKVKNFDQFNNEEVEF